MTGLKSRTLYEVLRQDILTGAIAPGQRLVMRRLAEQHAVSDIPVREALRMLQQDGLVEVSPYRGARVAAPSPDEVEEAYFIRGHLEGLATAEAVGHLETSHFEQLEGCLKRMALALDADDALGYAELNREFHQTIFDACPYRRLTELILGLWEGQGAYQSVFRLSPQRLHNSFSEHRALVDLLRAGDKSAVAEAARRHKLNVSKDLVACLRHDVAKSNSEGSR